MKLSLDPNSPVPLYHQIAEALSYQVATGRIPPGHRLPAVRDAAKAWDVNMHTVRRAYAELAERGLVEIRGSKGTRVCGTPGRAARRRTHSALDAFLERILSEGRAQHGLERHDLVRLLANWSPAHAGTSGVVHVVECSETQCDDHVREIEEHWDVEARPWCLSRSGEPPPGPIVATYFHHNEVRRRWPHRLQEIRFVAIHPDPQLPSDRRTIVPSGKRLTLTLCEFDDPMASNIAADLSVLFPADRYCIKTRVVTRGSELLGTRGQRKPILLSPRVWDSLGPEARMDRRAIKIAYVIAEEELENLGHFFGWRRRRRGRHPG